MATTLPEEDFAYPGGPKEPKPTGAPTQAKYQFRAVADANYVMDALNQLKGAVQALEGTTPTIPAPTITGASPNSGAVGDVITFNGTNLTGASAFRFNGTLATTTNNTATSIKATVPAGATSGTVSITTPGGTATSTGSFTVTVPSTLPVLIDYFGDSLTEGAGEADPNLSYPAQLKARLGTVDFAGHHNYGIGGQPLADIAASIMDQLDLHLAWDPTQYAQALCIIHGSANDFRILGQDEPTADAVGRTYAAYELAVSKAVAAGRKVIIMTHANYDFHTPTVPSNLNETIRANTLELDRRLRAGWKAMGARALIELAWHENIGWNMPNAAYFSSDGAHMVGLGYGVVAEVAEPGVRAVAAGEFYGVVTPLAASPVISGFDQSVVYAGTTITVFGTGFANQTLVTVGTSTVTATNVTPTSLKFAAPATGGLISITNPAGTGTSSTGLTVNAAPTYPYATTDIIEQDSPSIWREAGPFVEYAGYPDAYGTDGIALLMDTTSAMNDAALTVFFNLAVAGRLNLWSYTNNLHGPFNVSVDGGAETTVPLNPALSDAQNIIYTTAVLPAGNHTLRLRRLAVNSNKYVTILRFQKTY